MGVGVRYLYPGGFLSIQSAIQSAIVEIAAPGLLELIEDRLLYEGGWLTKSDLVDSV